MRISGINFYPYQSKVNQAKNKNSSNKISFEAKPYRLPHLKIKNAYDAMVMYGFLSLGNYLDSSDDDVSPENKNIRAENLNFLNDLKTKEDKEQFIQHYKEITGFPNLEKVSEKIEREFILGITKSSIGIPGGECIAAGYDETCSVGKRRAFPGSDLDKSFIILKGSSINLEEDEKIVNQFKSNLWHNVDQRILSFNHDISFPSVYTLNQVLDKMFKIDKQIENVEIDKKALQKLMAEEYKNLEKASSYNVEISKAFDVVAKTPNELSKEEVKNFGYFIESVRDGKYLINSNIAQDLKVVLSEYPFYKYSNTAQMKSMKNAVKENRENKSKIIIRDNMEEKFNSWDINRQFEFIKTLIKYSCEDNEQFKEYFTNDRDAKKAYKPLLNILTRGDRNIYNRLEFEPIKNGLRMHYATDRFADLYQGYSNNVLWIDTEDSLAVEQALRAINKLKQSDLFANIDRIQCKKLDKDIEAFYPISFKTNDNEQIWERLL